jgi:hypothetical protein
MKITTILRLITAVALLNGCGSPTKEHPAITAKTRSVDYPHGIRESYTDDEFTKVGFHPTAAHRVLASNATWTGIVDVRNVVTDSRQEGDLLGASLSITKSSGWESIYHQKFLLRKVRTDADWSKAKIYILTSSEVFTLQDLLALHWNQIWNHVSECN